MKIIETRKQTRMGLAKTMQICLSGIYYRLFRSLVTVSIISVAVAFMVNMVASGIIGKAVQRHAMTEARQYKTYSRWLSWLEENMSRADIFRRVAQCEDGDPKIGAVAKWGSLSNAELQDLLSVSREAERYISFFESLSPGRRFTLAELADQAFLLDALLEEGAFSQFAARLADMPSVRMPGKPSEFRALLNHYQRQIPLWDAIVKGRDDAKAKLRDCFPGLSAADLLNEPPPNLISTLAQLGFAESDTDFTEIFERGSRELRLARVIELLKHSEFRRDLSERAAVDAASVNLNFFANMFLSDDGRAAILRLLAQNELSLGMEPDEMEETLRRFQRERRYLLIESEASPSSSALLGFDLQSLWLIGISFIVCVVGIANAMIMSVMERFKEIATMKCLGATDSFVMALFIFESCIQGAVGGAVGAAMGLLLSFPLMAFKYGTLAWSALPAQDMLAMSGLAFGTGVLLAAAASVYPAWMAAKLVPMEVMRLE